MDTTACVSGTAKSSHFLFTIASSDISNALLFKLSSLPIPFATRGYAALVWTSQCSTAAPVELARVLALPEGSQMLGPARDGECGAPRIESHRSRLRVHTAAGRSRTITGDGS